LLLGKLLCCSNWLQAKTKQNFANVIIPEVSQVTMVTVVQTTTPTPVGKLSGQPNQSINQSINRSVKQASNQATNQPTNQPINQSRILEWFQQ